jgi:hypothetical protein
MGRLRKSLLAYYKYEAAGEPVQIDIPKRKYIAVFTFLSPATNRTTMEPTDVLGSGPDCNLGNQSAEIYNKSAVGLYKAGQYGEAEPVLKRVLAIREQSLVLLCYKQTF